MLSKEQVQLFILLFTIFIFSSCSKSSDTIKHAATTAVEDIGCANVQSKIYDSLYNYVNETEVLPDSEVLSIELSQAIDKTLLENQQITNEQDRQQYRKMFNDFTIELINSVKSSNSKKSRSEILQALIERELGDETALENKNTNAKLSTRLTQLIAKSNELNLKCAQEETQPVQNENELIQQDSPQVFQQKITNNINNVFAIAYQSCRVLEVPAMSDETPNVEGIQILSEPNPDNGGVQRVIGNLKKVQTTHPYNRVSGTASSSCFNVRGNPMIYDFGGKPRWKNSTLDFTTNSGTGTSALGIDCSGFIGAVLASSGLRLSPGLENKPVYVEQKSDKYIDAKASGLKCFQNIAINAKDSIKPGDIAAIKGHVVIIDSIGADPFGIKAITSQSMCSRMTIDRFDFVVAQSSPSKEGVGMNKSQARDYLKQTEEMKDLFLEFAKATCASQFTLKTVTLKFSDYGIIRHNGTKDCLAPKVTMVRQSCVSACMKN